MPDAGANSNQDRSSNLGSDVDGPRDNPQARTTRLLTTTISLSREDLELINRVALFRKFRRGSGRTSVSEVVRDLINRYRAVLEDEARQ